MVTVPETPNTDTSDPTETHPTQEDSANTLKILIATDIHLGYEEKDPLIGNDSFITFEEILQHGLSNGVDFILLGGDLFHHAVPSTAAINRCLQLLRNYCMGEQPIEIELLSDPSLNFPESMSRSINYEDPNLNISLPVFSIHGNHDDYSGMGGLSVLDIFSTSGLLNYFGKWSSLEKVKISPILLQKGTTRLALFGLSHIHDARLARLFYDGNVEMEQPADRDEWFNMFVLHQNRQNRGVKNFLPEDSLPEFLDLVLWGHEHDCHIEAAQNEKKRFWVTQPGSSVATSLAEGEALPKHCGILYINGKDFKIQPIPLATVRPFVFDVADMTLHSADVGLEHGGDDEKKMTKFARDRIEGMLRDAHSKRSGNKLQPELPLIRLRIDVTDDSQMFNAIRFGQDYVGRVANPTKMVTFKRSIKRGLKTDAKADLDAMKNAFDAEREERQQVRVEDIVNRYFAEMEDESKKLEVFSARSLSEMTRRLVDIEDEDASEKIINHYIRAACAFLDERQTTEDEVDDALEAFRATDDDVYQQMLKELEARGTRPKTAGRAEDPVMILDDDDDEPMVAANPAPARGGRGRGSRGGGRGSRGGRAAATPAPAPAAAKSSRTTSRQKQATIQPPITQSFTQKRGANRSSAVSYISDSDDE